MKFMVGNNIKSATKFFGIADDQKKTGKKILQILFYFTQQRHWVTYLKVIGRWSLQVEKLFAQDKPIWKWFMSISMADAQAPVVKNGSTVL